MKKLTATLCLLLITLITLSACGGDAVELLAFIGEDLSDSLDLGGYNVNIYFDGGSDIIGEMSVFNYKTGSLEEDAALSRIKEIEKNNCTITLHGSIDRTMARMKMMAGSESMDLVKYENFGAMQDYAKAKLLLPITDFSDIIDLSDSEKYGGANVLESSMIDSIPYAVQPIQWPGYEPLECFLIVFNKDILSENGYTDFHEYYENGTWTWDTYENEILKKVKVTNPEGVIPTLYTHEANFFKTVLFSNNNQYLTKNESGETEIVVYSTAFTNAYTTACRWYAEYSDIIALKGGYHEIDPFLEGNAVSALAHPEAVTTGEVAYNTKGSFAYGIMPFPCGPQSPYGQWAQCMERSRGFGIPVNSNDPEVAAHVIDLLFEPFEEFGGEGGLYDYYKDSVFLNEVDAEIYFALCENVRYDYGFDGSGNGPGSNIQDYFSAALKSGKPVQETLDSYRNAMVTMIEDYMLENFDYVYENYYSKLEN